MTTDLPRGWSVAKLDECCATVEKVDPRKNPDTSFDYIDIGGIEPGSGRIGSTKRLRGSDAPSRARQLVRAGDVILSTVRTYQRKTAIVPESLDRAVASTGFCVLRPHRGINSRFILHQLLDNGFVERLTEKQTGTSYPAVRDRDVRAMSIRLAPEVEQRRIVAAIEEHFSRLDAAEHALAAAHRQLDALYRSVAVDAFDRPDWDWTTLGEIAKVKGGITKDSKREADPEFEEFPYLRVANVQRGYLDLSDVTMIRADPGKVQRLVLRPGDLLFNEGGDRDKLGRGWVWEGQIEDCIHQNHVFRARLLDDRFDPYFVSLHANSWGQQWFEAHGKQTTNLASLNLTTLRSFPVPAPSLQEQRAVASRLRSALDSIQHQRFELERVATRTSSLRRSILAEAFAGRLMA